MNPKRDGVPCGVETGIRLTAADADVVHADLQSRGVDVGELLRCHRHPRCSPSATRTATA